MLRQEMKIEVNLSANFAARIVFAIARRRGVLPEIPAIAVRQNGERDLGNKFIFV